MMERTVGYILDGQQPSEAFAVAWQRQPAVGSMMVQMMEHTEQSIQLGQLQALGPFVG